MIKVGECYYHNEIEHLVIAVSKNKNKCLIVSITSNNYDKSCELNTEDIIDNNGNQVLKHTSYISYTHAQEFEPYKTYEEFRKIFSYRCNITDELLQQIKNGALKSKYLQKRFKKYFEE